MSLRYGAIRILCSGCDFMGDFSQAVEHHRATGHTVTFRGTPQDLSKFDSPEQYEREAEIREHELRAQQGFR